MKAKLTVALLTLVMGTTANADTIYQGTGVDTHKVNGDRPMRITFGERPNSPGEFVFDVSPTWTIETTVADGAQNATVNGSMSWSGRLEFDDNVYTDIEVKALIDPLNLPDMFDLNPHSGGGYRLGNNFLQRNLVVSGTFFNRGFENEYSGLTTISSSDTSQLGLKYDDYPDQLAFATLAPFERPWRNGPDLEPGFRVTGVSYSSDKFEFPLMPVAPTVPEPSSVAMLTGLVLLLPLRRPLQRLV